MLIEFVLFSDSFDRQCSHFLHFVLVEESEGLFDWEAASGTGVLDHCVVDDLDRGVLGYVLVLLVAAVLAD